MDNYLSHEGVKGMRWGERRYQYKDGSLTPEGRRHYGYGEARSSMKSEIKIMREKARAERAMVREKARASRAMEKQLNKERLAAEKVQRRRDLQDERSRQRHQLKLQKIKNKERDKRSEEFKKRNEERAKQQAIEREQQKKQMAEFKKKHPLQYRRMKKYLREDGTLNEAGQALYFGNGQKKKIYQMSNEDLKKTTDRLYLEKNYKDAVYRLKEQDNHGAKAKIVELAKTGGITFASQFAANSLSSLFKNGPDGVKNDVAENGKQALEGSLDAMGTVLTKQLGLSGKKGNASYNAFRDAINFTTDEARAKRQGEQEAAQAIKNIIKNETKDRIINAYKDSKKPKQPSLEESYLSGKKIKDTFMRDYKTGAKEQYAKSFTSTFAALDNPKLSDKQREKYLKELDELMDKAYK